jgi:NitT/TauT family transport system permease protein
MKLKDHKSINYILALIIVVGIWELAGIIINKSLLPPLSSVLGNIIDSFGSKIYIHIAYSIKRIAIGIISTIIIGVPVGISMGYFKRIDNILSPILYFNYPIPKLSLLPIVMLIFGLGEATKVIMVFLITFFPIVVNVRDKVKSIPEEVYYPLYSLGASDYQIITEIILPGILPVIFSSVRIGIGTAISVLFFTENFGTEYGMGYFIMDSWMRVSYIEMYSGIIILSVIGLILFTTIDIFETIICPWK